MVNLYAIAPAWLPSRQILWAGLLKHIVYSVKIVYEGGHLGLRHIT